MLLTVNKRRLEVTILKLLRLLGYDEVALFGLDKDTTGKLIQSKVRAGRGGGGAWRWRGRPQACGRKGGGRGGRSDAGDGLAARTEVAAGWMCECLDGGFPPLSLAPLLPTAIPRTALAFPPPRCPRPIHATPPTASLLPRRSGRRGRD